MDGNADLRWAAPFYPASHRTYSPGGRTTLDILAIRQGKGAGPQPRGGRKEKNLPWLRPDMVYTALCTHLKWAEILLRAPHLTFW